MFSTKSVSTDTFKSQTLAFNHDALEHVLNNCPRSERLLISPYCHPDADGLASALAMRELLSMHGFKNCKVILSGKMQYDAGFLYRHFELDRMTSVIRLPVDQFPDFGRIILVDTPSVKEISEEINPARAIAIIDHHALSPSPDHNNAFIQQEVVGANATLMTEFYSKRNLIPGSLVTHLLSAAIDSNTLRLASTGTTERDKLAKFFLDSHDSAPSKLTEKMFASRTSAIHQNPGKFIVRDLDPNPLRIQGNEILMAQLEAGGIADLFTNNIPLLENVLLQIAAEKNVSGVSLSGLDHDLGATYFFLIFHPSSANLFSHLKASTSEGFPIVPELLSRKDIRRNLARLLAD